MIKEERRKHFDPEVVDAFFAVRDEILSIEDKYQDEEESLLVRMAGKTS